MNLFTRKMRLLTAVVLDEDKEKVVKNLLSYGVMDFIHIEGLDPEQMKKIHKDEGSGSTSELSEYRIRIENLLEQADHRIPALSSSDLESTDVLDLDKLRRFIERLTLSTQSIKDRQRIVNQRYLTHEEMLRYIDEKKNEYLDLRVGSVPSRSEDFAMRLRQLGSVVDTDGLSIAVLSFKRESSRVDDLFDKFHWTESSDVEDQKGAMLKMKADLNILIEDDKKDMDVLKKEVKDKIGERIDDIEKAWLNVRIHELCGSDESYFSYTKNTTLLSGWVPDDEYQKVYQAIIEATDGRCIIEAKDATEMDRESVPVSMSSPKVLKPFEHLVNNYGTPEYGSINPTPFTAISYIVMFALMFADLGQGFVLLLVALIGTWQYKRNPLRKDGLISRYLCSLLMFLGPASMVGGLLFGSCFGYSWIPALWFNYHSVVNGHGGNGFVNDIYDILGITIKFGIVIIFLALVLNWINLFRKKRYFELIFDKNGLVGGAFYAIGIYIGFGFVASGYKSMPNPSWLVPSLVVLVLMVFLSEPIDYVIKLRKGHKEKVSQLVINTLMESLITLLEIFSGFLANTLSFMRVAGLGIAHVSLMTAFQDMADMTGNVVFGTLIIIVGNVLVIVLEGLSAGINSLRLNYYEFFTRFFTGRGFAYEPIGLNGRRKAN